MSTVPATLSDLRATLCELADNRFDRRYRSLGPAQRLVTMGLAVWATLYVAGRYADGATGSLLLLATPFVVFATLATLFARLNDR